MRVDVVEVDEASSESTKREEREGKKKKIIFRKSKSFPTRGYIYIHVSSAREPCALLRESVLGLHLYYPAPWGGVDQWLFKTKIASASHSAKNGR